MTNDLYIIGNGFDLHHKYRSGLADYGKWLMDNHPNIYYSFEEWFDIPVYAEDDTDQYKEWKNWWSYFEQRLGELSIRNYIEDASFRAFNEAIQVEERRAYDTYAGERIADTELSNLIAQIKGTFREWIQSLLPGEKWYRLPIERESSLFLTFNYTPTLETIYKIQRGNILHIHGSIDSDEYILGHGLSYQEIVNSCESGEVCPDNLSIEEMEEWYSSHSDDFITEQAKKIAIERMFDLRKDVEQIIEDNHSFFNQLSSLETIHIYGFSFSPIDLPYLYTILAQVNKQTVKWEISYFSDEDKENAEQFIEAANIPKENVHLIMLTDIHLDPQLKIPFEQSVMRKLIIILTCLMPMLSFGQGKVTRPIHNTHSSADSKKQQEQPFFGTTNGYDWVDLGLPSGTKWATCNVGAETPNDNGDYFAWGETSTKTIYDHLNSIAWDKDKSKLQSEGIINSKDCLTMSCDAARKIWGGTWRIPTDSEWKELEKRCIWEWVPDKGYKVIGPNGHSIFLPAAGYKGRVLSYVGESGWYWSSIFHSTGFAGGMLFKIDYYGNPGTNCSSGQSIRPVMSK